MCGVVIRWRCRELDILDSVSSLLLLDGLKQGEIHRF